MSNSFDFVNILKGCLNKYDCNFNDIVSNSFDFANILKGCLNKYDCNFNDISKVDTPDLLKMKIFWIKVYDVTISAHDVTSKIFPRDSNYIVDVNIV